MSQRERRRDGGTQRGEEITKFWGCARGFNEDVLGRWQHSLRPWPGKDGSRVGGIWLKRYGRMDLYGRITPVSAELIDDPSLLLIVPAEDRLAKADAAAGRALGAGDVASVFDQEDEEYLTPNS